MVGGGEGSTSGAGAAKRTLPTACRATQHSTLISVVLGGVRAEGKASAKTARHQDLLRVLPGAGNRTRPPPRRPVFTMSIPTGPCPRYAAEKPAARAQARAARRVGGTLSKRGPRLVDDGIHRWAVTRVRGIVVAKFPATDTGLGRVCLSVCGRHESRQHADCSQRGERDDCTHLDGHYRGLGVRRIGHGAPSA